MALIKCAECSKEISDKAAACSNCGAPAKPAAGQQMTRVPQGSIGSRKFLMISIAIVAIVGGSVLIVALTGKSSPPDTRSSEEKRRAEHCNDTSVAVIDAERMAKQFVESALRSPSPAKFVEAKVTYDGSCGFTMAGKVDAQNAVGAMIRSGYTAALQYRPGDDKWLRVSINIRTP